MIILKHLTVERFRLLRELNLHFPQRGSILIQGPNEAGKSSLLESIYFALYGEALAPSRGRRSLDDLISYGATSAVVTLTLAIGANDLIVTRTLERGKGQSIRLLIHRLSSSEKEIITNLAIANKRIIVELGQLDAVTFRSAFLIEQKGLDRLERLSGVEREAATRKLLCLEKLTRLTEQFQVTPEDGKQLKECTDRFQLAEIQVRIPELSKQLDQIEAALDAVKLCEELDAILEQENEIAEQQKTIAQIKNKTSRTQESSGTYPPARTS
jgi:DNA repair exonuclease SbcCD ATPase subunit